MSPPAKSPSPRGGQAASSTSSLGDFTTAPERALTGTELAQADPAPRFRIGEVADRIGLSLRSIRYYEEAGLVTPAARTSGGFRMYSELDVQRLLCIMQMKPLDFSLEAMRDVLVDLDILRDESAPAGERTAAHSRLNEVKEDVELRWQLLRRRVDVAATFRQQLGDELASYSTPG